MSLVTHAQRIREPNPVFPYSWEAVYDRGRLRQHDIDGWHTSRDIDRRRLRSLVIHGHPASPIALGLPAPPWPEGPAPTAVIVQATTDVRHTVKLGTRAAQREVRTWVFFGLTYGAAAALEHYVLQIDPAGHLLRTMVPTPVSCARCGA